MTAGPVIAAPKNMSSTKMTTMMLRILRRRMETKRNTEVKKENTHTSVVVSFHVRDVRSNKFTDIYNTMNETIIGYLK